MLCFPIEYRTIGKLILRQGYIRITWSPAKHGMRRLLGCSIVLLNNRSIRQRQSTCTCLRMMIFRRTHTVFAVPDCRPYRRTGYSSCKSKFPCSALFPPPFGIFIFNQFYYCKMHQLCQLFGWRTQERNSIEIKSFFHRPDEISATKISSRLNMLWAILNMRCCD